MNEVRLVAETDVEGDLSEGTGAAEDHFFCSFDPHSPNRLSYGHPVPVSMKTSQMALAYKIGELKIRELREIS